MTTFVDRDRLIQAANSMLRVWDYKDYGPMGAQYIGCDKIKKIVSGVSICEDLIYEAAGADADAILVHHGLFWDTEPLTLDMRLEDRLIYLDYFDMNLLSYHLALDAHEHFGNNVNILKTLGCTDLRRFADVGWGGILPKDWTIQPLLDEFGGSSFYYFAGQNKPHRAAVVTGSGGKLIHEAHNEGYDLFITGELEEPSKALAKELDIGLVALGHHQSEKSGIRELGKRLAIMFGIEHEFVDIDNPV